MSIDRTFHDGDEKKLWNWIYDFLARQHLSIRRPTRQGQKLSSQLEEIKEGFVSALTERFLPFGTLSNVAWDRVVNMDETPINLEPKPHSTVSQRERKRFLRLCASRPTLEFLSVLPLPRPAESFHLLLSSRECQGQELTRLSRKSYLKMCLVPVSRMFGWMTKQLRHGWKMFGSHLSPTAHQVYFYLTITNVISNLPSLAAWQN
ncbi:hypothetical protein AC1031_005422 [Aphanomyces cochlioides]|nr:hypothetical protein AC1031_005422 [Aphanomyces cochlioides]